MKKKTYIFIGDSIYSPEPQDNVMGEEVEIIKKDGDEVYFTVLSTGKKGYVVIPELFIENSHENRIKMREYKDKLYHANLYLKEANEILYNLNHAKLGKHINK